MNLCCKTHIFKHLLYCLIFFHTFLFSSGFENNASKINDFKPAPPANISFFPQDKSAKLPVLYKGRIQPFSVACRQWLYNINQRDVVRGSKFTSFKASFSEDLTWKILLFGYEPWDYTRIFFIQESLSKRIGLNPLKKRFVLRELEIALNNTEDSGKEINELKQKAESFKNPEIYFLPLKFPEGSFGRLNLLEEENDNFTMYSDEHFLEIKTLYLALKESLLKENTIYSQTLSFALIDKLIESYDDIESKPIKETLTKKLNAPTRLMLSLEDTLYTSSFLDIIFYLFSLAAFSFILYFFSRKTFFNSTAIVLIIIGFVLQTALLALRSFILRRPPVSNMFETVIYVPWITVLASIIVSFFSKNKILLFASALLSTLLYGLINFTQLNHNLENLQAVLDSNYWLTIHVMLIVASYGLFLLSGLLAHFAIVVFFIKKHLPPLDKLIWQINYIGIAMLISGTLLGGVWAQESWGRFWDWDPKESWAFISCAVYIAIVHAYKYKIIKEFGLVIGSIIGVNVITFTWYGVNYILGQGLHSYGFGSGGQPIYWSFVFFETLLILVACAFNQKKRLN